MERFEKLTEFLKSKYAAEERVDRFFFKHDRMNWHVVLQQGMLTMRAYLGQHDQGGDESVESVFIAMQEVNKKLGELDRPIIGKVDDVDAYMVLTFSMSMPESDWDADSCQEIIDGLVALKNEPLVLELWGKHRQ